MLPAVSKETFAIIILVCITFGKKNANVTLAGVKIGITFLWRLPHF